jgi:hypothetical protein
MSEDPEKSSEDAVEAGDLDESGGEDHDDLLDPPALPGPA